MTGARTGPPIRRALGTVIRTYQAVTACRPPRCRFVPTCSDYALEAISGHGVGRGTWLSIRRLARCQPLGGHGFDPVPRPSEAVAPAERRRTGRDLMYPGTF